MALGLCAAVSSTLLAGCASSSEPSAEVGSAFCSPEALVDLIPSLRNAEGQFQLPDPRTDLQGFYDAHQAITRAIEVALVQSQMATTPGDAAAAPHQTMTFGAKWRSAESGVSTDGSTITLPENGGRFAAFGGPSFLSGIAPIAETGDSVYKVVESDGSISALVAAQPTNLPCVNRIILAEESSGGTYIDAKRDQSMTWGTLRVTDWIKAVTSPNPQRYPVTDTWYPNRWEFEFDEVVPEDIRRVTMTPIVQVAQVGFFANGSQYAEGAVVLTDPNGTDIGRGFAESVAYANTVSTTYRLAGLPDSQSHHDVLSHLKIPTSLALLNTAYVLAHQTELAEVLSESVGLEFFTPSG
jgi:hypothetical protein